MKFLDPELFLPSYFVFMYVRFMYLVVFLKILVINQANKDIVKILIMDNLVNNTF